MKTIFHRMMSYAAMSLLCLLAGNAAAVNSQFSSDGLGSEEQEFLSRAIAQTHYSALVVHTRVDIIPLREKRSLSGSPNAATEERHVYHARVIETFRGKTAPTIRYEVITDSGDGVQIDSTPRILTLCSGRGGFYWPGTGAMFKAKEASLVIARRVSREVAQAHSRIFAQCD